MAKINELIKTIADNFDGERFAKNRVLDIIDILGGSNRATTRAVTSDYLDDIDINEIAGAASGVTGFSPMTRLVSKPFRMLADASELVTEPLWSLKNNKIGLTKDAILIKLLTDYLNKDDEEGVVQ